MILKTLSLEGSFTPVGAAVIGPISKVLSGTTQLFGELGKAITKTGFEGVLGLLGSARTITQKVIMGAISFSGAALKNVAAEIGGAFTATSETLTKNIDKVISDISAFSAGFFGPTGQVFYSIIEGTLALNGQAAKSVGKLVSGSLGLAQTLISRVSYAIQLTVTRNASIALGVIREAASITLSHIRNQSVSSTIVRSAITEVEHIRTSLINLIRKE